MELQCKKQKALSLTLLDVYLATLDSCIGENVGISSEGLIVIRESIQAKCRMVEVISIDLENGQVLIPGRTPEAFLEIYTQFVRTTQFLRDNFNNLIFSSEVTREKVAGMLEKIKSPVDNRLRTMEAEGGGMFDMAELTAISHWFDLASQLILGEEIFRKFGNEINSAKVVLKKLRGQFGPSVDTRLQGGFGPD